MNANANKIEASNVVDYITAGKAVITIHSLKTDKHFTYHVCAPTTKTAKGGYKVEHEANVRFVKVLVGPDNGNDYAYAGILKRDADGNWNLHHGGAKANVGPDAPSWKAIEWSLAHVGHADVEFLHNGHCARCGRQLTHPESLSVGLGPECRKAA